MLMNQTVNNDVTMYSPVAVGDSVISFCFQSKQVQSWVVPNITAILSDFRTIGEGLEKIIEVLNA